MAATAQDPSAPLRSSEKQKDEDRDDDAAEYSPFYGIEKGAVLQEARIFNDSHVDARRCQQVITKLLYLLCQGESFTKKEETDVFFSVTKLFQAKDANLRRMVYLVIKEVCPGSDEVIIITSSLMKDMNSQTDLYRSNAIRVLCSIADGQVLGNIERYFKQAVVDKSPPVASAVLVSAMHLLKDNMEIVKRWTSEIQEVVQSKNGMVQYHAVALLHALRSRDRLAISKLVTSLVKGNVRSPMAQCLLVRYVAQVIAESGTSAGGDTRPFYDFLEGCLRHKAEMVIFEAARAICAMPAVTSRELTPAVTVLQLFLSSSKPVLRFAAVRTLNKVAMIHPLAVTNCNIDLEGLIVDQNRPIATLAITTLLKTGSEGSVDRLLKQIGNFMSDIADEFKIVVVEAIRSLCLKFPQLCAIFLSNVLREEGGLEDTMRAAFLIPRWSSQKYRALMNFLSNVLREDGGFEYKKAIVDSILILIKEIPEAKEPGLGHLCEFIEDCEFTYLSTQILHLLGLEGPATRDPAKYIRYIYNRIILENATVRAAAVSSLARFGCMVQDLRPRILVLLQRALHDNDDEVRDRATIHLAELRGEAGSQEDLASEWNVPARNLEQSLQGYLEGDKAAPFQLDSVPKAPPKEPKKDQTAVQSSAKAPPVQTDYSAVLAGEPLLAGLGVPFKSLEPLRLTEEETEYTVVVIKHILESHVVLQFDCTNTVAEQVLERVSIVLDLSEAEEFEQQTVVPLDRMVYNEVGHIYVVLGRAPNSLAFGAIVPTLQFKVKEIDPSTGEAEEDGYNDEYQLEDFEISAADYVKPEPVSNFRNAWEELGPESELTDDYGLGQRDSLQEAVEAVTGILGMAACEGSDAVPPNARSHTLLLAGSLIGGVQVVVRLSLGIDVSKKVAMKLTVRASTSELSEVIHQIIQSA